jgi:L-lactate utilization protein LutC
MNLLAEKEQLYRRFRSELAVLSGHSRLVSRKEISTAVAEILRSQQLKKVVGYDSFYLRSIQFKEAISKRVDAEIQWFPAAKPANFDEGEYRAALTNADAAITSAEYLIAQTGTVVFPGKQHPSKLISLLPPSLIVLASINSLRQDLETLNAELFAAGKDQSAATIFFTGPSRTADIEKILVLGVHGPKELFVVIVRD